MDRTGLINSIVEAAEAIARGRLGFAGGGPESRVYYEEGLSIALAAFKEADTGADPGTIALAEEAFLRQELFFCDERDTNAHGSLTTALQSFDDAFLCLEAVEETGYAAAPIRTIQNTAPTIFPKMPFTSLAPPIIPGFIMSSALPVLICWRRPSLNNAPPT